jgi:hypothetical protein
VLARGHEDSGQARLYYPVGVAGDPDKAEIVLERFLAKHPQLEKFQTPSAGFIGRLLLHAHSVIVAQLDPGGFRFTPVCAFLHEEDEKVFVEGALEVLVTPDGAHEVEETAGLTIVLALVHDTPLLAASPQVRRALRSMVDQLFGSGLRVPGGLTVRAGDRLPATHAARAYQRLDDARLHYGATTTLPTEDGGEIEVPKIGSTLILGADGNKSGLDRLLAIEEAVRRLGGRPILIRKMPDLLGSNVLQKVLSVAIASQTVLIDDTDPSGHITEMRALQEATVPYVVLRPKGRPSTAMTEPSLLAYKWSAVVEYDKEIAPVVETALQKAKLLSVQAEDATRASEWWRPSPR